MKPDEVRLIVSGLSLAPTQGFALQTERELWHSVLVAITKLQNTPKAGLLEAKELAAIALGSLEFTLPD